MTMTTKTTNHYLSEKEIGRQIDKAIDRQTQSKSEFRSSRLPMADQFLRYMNLKVEVEME